MTLEEKRTAIRKYCATNFSGMCTKDGMDCPLYRFPEDGCSENDDPMIIERNYNTLFGDNRPTPLEEKQTAIRNHCNSLSHGNGGCSACALFKTSGACYEDLNLVERNYDILFGKPLVSKETETFDIVNKAEHYNQGGIECIDAIKASMSPEEYAGFLKGQVIKYTWRYRHKGKPVEDLEKAQYYHNKLIELIKEREDTA